MGNKKEFLTASKSWVHSLILFWHDRNEVDLNANVAAKLADFGGGAHGLVGGEIAFPHFVKLSPFVKIGQKNGGLDDMLEVSPRLLQDVSEIVNRLGGLHRNIVAGVADRRAGGVDEIACTYGLAEGAFLCSQS